MCSFFRKMCLRRACKADLRIPAAQAVFSRLLRHDSHVPTARTSDNVCGKRHAADCGPSRSSPAAVNPAVVPEDGPMSSPHRSGITDAQATDCKSASAEDGGSFRTDRRRIVNHHRDYSEGVLVHNEIHLPHHPVIERRRTSAAATGGRKMVPPDAPAPLPLRHMTCRRS